MLLSEKEGDNFSLRLHEPEGKESVEVSPHGFTINTNTDSFVHKRVLFPNAYASLYECL